jgi:hypothetical protein
MRQVILLILAFSLYGCDSENTAQSPSASHQPVNDWRLTIHLPDVDLPVQLHLASDGSEAWFSNGLEKVGVPEISKQGKNWRLYFPAFNNTLLLHEHEDRLEGSLTLIKRGYEQLMQVTGEPDPGYHFVPNPQARSEFTGRWQVTFTDDGAMNPLPSANLTSKAAR